MPDKENKSEKVKVDTKTLQGLAGVDSHAENKPNPKHVVLNVHRYWYEPKQKDITDNPFHYNLPKNINDGKLEAPIAQILIDHVKKYGTINELIITGHGSKLHMGDKEGKSGLDIKEFLFSYEHFGNNEGLKFANRIVFNGCSTFSNLNDKEINYLRGFAKKHKIELVGTTSPQANAGLFSNIGINVGRYVQFTPKGEVIRDKEDDRYNPMALIGDDRSWVDFHLNHTQREGERSGIEAQKYWLNFNKKLTDVKCSREH